jgi:hypothetical protein
VSKSLIFTRARRVTRVCSYGITRALIYISALAITFCLRDSCITDFVWIYISSHYKRKACRTREQLAELTASRGS